jgi:hypothetical protein
MFMGFKPRANARHAIVSLALAMSILCSVFFSAARPAWAVAQDERSAGHPGSRRLPIMTWPGPDADLLSLATFRLAADAGFSINMSFLGSREENLKALELAGAAGLKLMIQDDRVSKLVEDDALPLDSLADIVKDYRSHPAFYGYFITDEPNASKFERLGAIVSRLRALDPGHPAYINLFPTYANQTQLGTSTYEEHVARYLEIVRPPFLSFDHYPVMKTGLRPDYYRNLEIVRRMAMERGLDLWAFTLVTPHAVYPPPAEGHVRLQIFSDIVYGSKGLQYFTFGTPGGTDYDWGSGLIGKNGRPGPAYSLAREVNAEIRRIEALVLRWKPLAVYHSEPVPEGARPLAPEGHVIGITGAPLIVGVFSDGPATYVMFVNRDYERPRTAIVHFAAVAQEAQEIAKNNRPQVRLAWPAVQGERVCVLEFGAGDARIFRLK